MQEQEHPTHHDHTQARLGEEKTSMLGPIIITILTIVIIILSGGMYYIYTQYTSLQKKIANPTVMANEELSNTLVKVSKLMELPSSEKPILATVTDREKLGGQPFFDKAILGDKVLIFVQAKKAILYRPSLNRVINVAPVALNLTPTPKVGLDGLPEQVNAPDNANQPVVNNGEQNIQNNPQVPQPSQ